MKNRENEIYSILFLLMLLFFSIFTYNEIENTKITITQNPCNHPLTQRCEEDDI